MRDAALRGTPALRLPPGLWVVGAAMAVGLGLLTAQDVPIAIGVMATAALLFVFARAHVKSEIVVALFWIAFCLYETIFASVTVEGFFYPFYVAFALSVAGSLLRSGVRVEAPVLWLYGSFLVVVLASFIGFGEPIGFEVIQRLFAYVFGLLVALQFGSRRGLRPVLAATVLTSLVISVWVIVSSFEADFAYRGGVTVDQNVVTFFIGFGAVVTLTAAVQAVARPGRRGRLFGLLVLLGTMLYAVMLLASRGVTLALALAVLAVLARATLQDRRRAVALVVVVALAFATVLLPGGSGLLERFALEDTESGNNRLPIWEATLDAYTGGDVYGLLLGQGFGSSRAVVQRAMGTLTSTHNAFLQILYEFGAVGIALFLALHAHLLVRAIRLADGHGLTMLGLLSFLIGANLSLNAPDGFMYWTALGVVIAIGLWDREAATAGPGTPSP
jgi:O-antigen ligase